MARAGADRPPYPAVVALAFWARDNWASLEHDWYMQDPTRAPLIDLPARRLFQIFYGALFARLPIEVHEEVRKKLDKDDMAEPGTQRSTKHSAEAEELAEKLGVQVPSWWDDDPWDAPADFTVMGTPE